VFAGGGTLEAIEAVCNADGALEVDVLDGVGSLVDKSLIRVPSTEYRVPSGAGILGTRYSVLGTTEEPRFGMLETIREYGRELLQSVEPGGGEELYRQHARYYLALAEEGREGIMGPQQEMWLDRVQVEHD